MDRVGEIKAAAARIGPVMVLTASSQLLAALSLLALPKLGLEVSDVYAVGIQSGNGAFAGVIVGVLYSLVIGRPNFAGWKSFGWAAAFFSVGLGIAAYMLISRAGAADRFGGGRTIIVMSAFSVGGALLALAGTGAVRMACMGKPQFLAGITLLPNLGLLIGVGVCLFDAGGAGRWTAVPALAWCAGAALAGLLIRSQVEGRVRQPADDTTENDEVVLTGHILALSIGVVTSTVLPTVFLTAVAQLPEGAATYLFIVARIGTAAIGLAVNSVLMARYNWHSSATARRGDAGKFMAGAFVLAIACLSLRQLNAPSHLAYGFLVAAWLLTLIAAPVVAREANARRIVAPLLAKSVADLVIAVFVAIVLSAKPTVSGYFSAFMISQCVTCAVLGIAMGFRRLGVASILVGALSMIFVVAGF